MSGGTRKACYWGVTPHLSFADANGRLSNNYLLIKNYLTLIKLKTPPNDCSYVISLRVLTKY